MSSLAVGFIGAGQMAEAIAGGMIATGLAAGDDLLAADPMANRREVFASLGVRTTEDNLVVAREHDILLIAVKPQNLNDVLREIGPELKGDQLVISICAGCPTTLFEAATQAQVRVVRAMPNLPMRVGMGATALCSGKYSTERDIQTAAKIFDATGVAVITEESLMDAVTAVSGSGPAYVYFLAEIMMEAGRKEGLPDEVARRLVIQTVRGAAEMMAEGEATPEELRAHVTSKGGTTEAALRSMEESGARQALLDAIGAAARRARELGRK